MVVVLVSIKLFVVGLTGNGSIVSSDSCFSLAE